MGSPRFEVGGVRDQGGPPARLSTPLRRGQNGGSGEALGRREGLRSAAWGNDLCDLSARGHGGETWGTGLGDGLREADDADRTVHLEFAAGALHLDKVTGGKPGADTDIQRRTSPDALGVPTFKSSFETLTDWTRHNFPLRH